MNRMMNENEKGTGHFFIWDGGFFKILRPKLFLAEPGQSNYNGNRHSKRGRMHMKSILLCYNLKGTKKGRKIGMLGSFLGFRVKYVDVVPMHHQHSCTNFLIRLMISTFRVH